MGMVFLWYTYLAALVKSHSIVVGLGSTLMSSDITQVICKDDMSHVIYLYVRV